MIIVDAVLSTSTENKCFQNMNSQSPYDQLTRITGKRTMACTPGPSGLMELPEAVHHTYPRTLTLPGNY